MRPLPDGLFIDPEKRVFEVLGVRLPVASGQFSPADEPRPYAQEDVDFAVRFGLTPPTIGLLTCRMPEAWHLNALCGENGWWLEVHIYPAQPWYSEGIDLALPHEPHDEGRFDIEPQAILDLWRETGARRDHPRDFPSVGEYADPYSGLRPGAEWIGVDEVDEHA